MNTCKTVSSYNLSTNIFLINVQGPQPLPVRYLKMIFLFLHCVVKVNSPTSAGQGIVSNLFLISMLGPQPLPVREW